MNLMCGKSAWCFYYDAAHSLNINNCKPLTPHPSDLQTACRSKSWLPSCGAVHASKTRGVPPTQESIISASASQKKGTPPMPVRAPRISFCFLWGFLYTQAAVQVPLCQVLLNTTTEQTCWEHLSQWDDKPTDWLQRQSELEGGKYGQLQATGNPALINKMFL